MSYKISCYTLFDITQTGVINRGKPGIDEDMEAWLFKRNTQCNFDTILQVVSLRSQPEDISKPKVKEISLSEFQNFGFLLENDEKVNSWSFSFTIQHPSVFNDGISDLGSLYNDCDQVPMIKTDTIWNKIPAFLDSSDELRNIYFKVENDD
jgi:hypothetical protein